MSDEAPTTVHEAPAGEQTTDAVSPSLLPGNLSTTDHLGSRAAAGGVVTLVGQVLRVGLQTISIVLLAHLIAPADFGLIVMVTAIISVGEVIRDLGLSMASIQSKSLSSAQRDNLFWVNTAIGLILTVGTYFLAVPLGELYSEPRLVEITRVLSCTFLINGIATQYRAQIARQMKFFALAWVSVFAQLVGLLVAVVLATANAGYWALVWQQVAQVACICACFVLCGRWIPGLPSTAGNITEIVRIGGPLAGTQLLGYFSRNIDSFMIGLTVGAAPLGIYSRAFQILMMPLNQINAPATTVALPVLSRLQDDPGRFQQFILRGQTIMMNITAMILAIGLAVAAPMVPMVFGDGWAGVAPVFQVLCFAGLFQVASYASYWVFLSLGLTSSNLRFALASRPAMIALIVLGAQFGLFGVAAAYSLSVGLIWIWGLWWLRKVETAPVRAMLKNGCRCVGVYSFAGLSGLAVTLLTERWDDLWSALAGAAAALSALILLALTSSAYRADLRLLAGACSAASKRLHKKGTRNRADGTR